MTLRFVAPTNLFLIEFRPSLALSSSLKSGFQGEQNAHFLTIEANLHFQKRFLATFYS